MCCDKWLHSRSCLPWRDNSTLCSKITESETDSISLYHMLINLHILYWYNSNKYPLSCCPQFMFKSYKIWMNFVFVSLNKYTAMNCVYVFAFMCVLQNCYSYMNEYGLSAVVLSVHHKTIQLHIRIHTLDEHNLCAKCVVFKCKPPCLRGELYIKHVKNIPKILTNILQRITNYVVLTLSLVFYNTNWWCSLSLLSFVCSVATTNAV